MNILDIFIKALGVIVGCFVAYSFSKHFLSLTKEKQINNIKEWLVYACIEAEKLLGSNTGKVKLRYVYDLFVSKYKIISILVPFETFSLWVDEALEHVRLMIESNEAIDNYINKK